MSGKGPQKDRTLERPEGVERQRFGEIVDDERGPQIQGTEFTERALEIKPRPTDTAGQMAEQFPEIIDNSTHLVPLGQAGAACLTLCFDADRDTAPRLERSIKTDEKIIYREGKAMRIVKYVIRGADSERHIEKLQEQNIGVAVGSNQIFYRFGLTGQGLILLEEHAYQVHKVQAKAAQNPTLTLSPSNEPVQIHQNGLVIPENTLKRLPFPIIKNKPAYVGEIKLPTKLPPNQITLVIALIIEQANSYNIPTQVVGNGQIRFLVNEEAPRYGIRFMLEFFDAMKGKIEGINLKIAQSSNTSTIRTADSDQVLIESDAWAIIDRMPDIEGAFSDQATGLKATNFRETIYRPQVDAMSHSSNAFRLSEGRAISNNTEDLRIEGYLDSEASEDLIAILTGNRNVESAGEDARGLATWTTITGPATFGKTSLAQEHMNRGYKIEGDFRAAWPGFRQFAEIVRQDVASFERHFDRKAELTDLELFETTGGLMDASQFELNAEQLRSINNLQRFINGDPTLQPVDVAQAIVNSLVLRKYTVPEGQQIQVLLDDIDRLDPYLAKVVREMKRMYLARRDQIQDVHIITTVREYITEDGQQHVPSHEELQNGEHVITIKPFVALSRDSEDGSWNQREGIGRCVGSILKRIGLIDNDFDGEFTIETYILEQAAKIARFEEEEESDHALEGSPEDLKIAFETLAILNCIEVQREGNHIRINHNSQNKSVIEQEVREGAKNEIIPRQIDLKCEREAGYLPAMTLVANSVGLESALFEALVERLKGRYPEIESSLSELRQRRQLKLESGTVKMHRAWQEAAKQTLPKKDSSKYDEVLLAMKDIVAELDFETDNKAFPADYAYTLAQKVDDQEMMQKYAYQASVEALDTHRYAEAFERASKAREAIRAQDINSIEATKINVVFAKAALFCGKHQEAEAMFKILLGEAHRDNLERSEVGDLLVSRLQLYAVKALQARNGSKEGAIEAYKKEIEKCEALLAPNSVEHLYTSVHKLYLQTLKGHTKALSPSDYNNLIGEAEKLESEIDSQTEFAPDTESYNAFNRLNVLLQAVIQNLHIEKARHSVNNDESAVVQHALSGHNTENGVNISTELQKSIRHGGKGMRIVHSIGNVGMGLYPEARLSTFSARSALETSYDAKAVERLVEQALSYIYDVDPELGGQLIAQLQSATETRLVTDEKLQTTENQELRTQLRDYHQRLVEIGLKREMLRYRKAEIAYKSAETTPQSRPTLDMFIGYNAAEEAVYRGIRNQGNQELAQAALDRAWNILDLLEISLIAQGAMENLKPHWEKLLASFYLASKLAGFEKRYPIATRFPQRPQTLEVSRENTGTQAMATIENKSQIEIPKVSDEFELRKVPPKKLLAVLATLF